MRIDPGWRQSVAPWLLIIAGGGMDAVILLGFNVLTAAQTGNTILLAVALARGDAVGGPSAALSVLAFVVGAVLGALLLRVRAGAAAAPVLPALLAEALLLVALIAFWIGAQPLDRHEGLAVVALAALAMGLQSALALHLRGPSTTYMTGTLTSFSTALAGWIGPRRPAADPPPSGRGDRPASVPAPWRSGLTWLLYLSSAVGSGLLFLRVDVLALLVPATAVALVLLLAIGAGRAGELPPA